MIAGGLGGAVWAGIAGALKAIAGTNEVISTIMLNWIAIWIGICLFNRGGPLQNSNPAQQDVPVSNDIVEGAKLPVFWGDPVLQGLHVGLFIALAAAARLLGDPEPHDARLRGPRGRLQPGRGGRRRASPCAATTSS